MKIIDFDKKFFEFARKWVLSHPGLNEDQIEASYNQMMQEWISAPADWLDGASPETYFSRFTTAEELISLMKAYSQQGVNLPEPLYARIVEMGAACAPKLLEILSDDTCAESLRAEAMGMLRDTGADIADEYLIRLVCTAEENNELSELAADILSGRGEAIAKRLLDQIESCPPYAQLLILDICCNYPGDDRLFEQLVYRLKNDPDQRALWASCLGKLGDERAIEPLKEMLELFDLRYLDYIEIRAAVEELGGEAGEDRAFWGDPDFEALRNL